MKTLAAPCEGEIIEKKSRFIAKAVPVSSEEEAAAFFAEEKKKYWDARHHCTAFVIGENPARMRSSDDGEPSGTAGKPMLEVLAGSGLTDVAAVVTRYFGGTLLGTGGLVRAYSGAVKEALANGRIIEKIPGKKYRLVLDYTLFPKVQNLALQQGIALEDIAYTEVVETTIRVPLEETGRLKKVFLDETNGRLQLGDGEDVLIEKEV